MQGDTAPLRHAQAEAEGAAIPEETVGSIPLDVVDEPLVDTLEPSRHSRVDLGTHINVSLAPVTA